MSTLREVLQEKGSKVHSITSEATVHRAVDEMCRARIGALLVMEGSVPVGIISERDMLTRVMLEQRDPVTTSVADAMTRNVACIAIDQSVEEAMAVMTEKRCRHLPVVVDGKVAGIVSIGDLVRWASRYQEYEIQMLHEYIGGQYPR